jgi:hypothetical protein
VHVGVHRYMVFRDIGVHCRCPRPRSP